MNRKTSPSAVVDASAIFLYFNAHEGEERHRNARSAISELRAQGIRFVIPAPVLGELPAEYLQIFREELRGLYVPPFDHEAAESVRPLVRSTMKFRHGKRACLKFDAMILAIALQKNARYILTGGDNDFVTLMNRLNRPPALELVDISKPIKGQALFSFATQ